MPSSSHPSFVDYLTEDILWINTDDQPVPRDCPTRNDTLPDYHLLSSRTEQKIVFYMTLFFVLFVMHKVVEQVLTKMQDICHKGQPVELVKYKNEFFCKDFFEKNLPDYYWRRPWTLRWHESRLYKEPYILDPNTGKWYLDVGKDEWRFNVS